MSSKKYIFSTVLVIYLILIVLVIVYRRSNSSSNLCNASNHTSCVRFCCFDQEKCSQTFIKANFNESLVPTFENRNLSLLFGKPDCVTMKPLEPKVRWKFNFVGDIESEDKITRQVFIPMTTDDYCLESREDAEKSVTQWEVHHCGADMARRVLILRVYLGMTLISVTAAMVAYIVTKALDTLPGKCEFMFLVGLLITYLANLWVHRDIAIVKYAITIGFLVTFLWFNVLIYDIWRTFKNKRLSSDGWRRFDVYCFFIFVAVSLCTFAQYTTKNAENGAKFVAAVIGLLIALSFFVMAILSFVLFVLAGVKVFKMSKAPGQDQTWLVLEKSRFLTYVVVYIVISILWLLENIELQAGNSFVPDIIYGVFTVFSISIITLTLACKKTSTFCNQNKIEGVPKQTSV